MIPIKYERFVIVDGRYTRGWKCQRKNELPCRLNIKFINWILMPDSFATIWSVSHIARRILRQIVKSLGRYLANAEKSNSLSWRVFEFHKNIKQQKNQRKFSRKIKTSVSSNFPHTEHYKEKKKIESRVIWNATNKWRGKSLKNKCFVNIPREMCVSRVRLEFAFFFSFWLVPLDEFNFASQWARQKLFRGAFDARKQCSSNMCTCVCVSSHVYMFVFTWLLYFSV